MFSSCDAVMLGGCEFSWKFRRLWSLGNRLNEVYTMAFAYFHNYPSRFVWFLPIGGSVAILFPSQSGSAGLSIFFYIPTTFSVQC
jgi:hypothetical protein